MFSTFFLSLAFFSLTVGEAPSEWKADPESWQNTEKSLTLETLKGKAVLLRWFTEESCPYCKISAPALNAWYEELASEGLVVVGFYHHKRAGSPHPKLVERTVRIYGFRFPVAIDSEWATLNAWWLDESRAEDEPLWTSISVLIGRDGKVAYIHPGGSYEKGDPDHTKLDAAIRKALASK